MATEFNSEFITYLTPDNAPAAGDKFYFYEPGTNTPKTIYSDAAATTPIDGNPALADSRGNLPKIYLEGTYRILRLNKDDVEIKDSDPVGDDVSQGPLTAWNSVVTYSIGDLVQGSDDAYYISITNSNLGNDPTSSPANWTEIRFLGIWNTNQTYAIGEVVQTTDGNVWRSITNGNSGNDPATDTGANWLPAVSFDALSQVIPQTGGGTLTAGFRVNELRDASTYTLPLANSVNANQTIKIALPDRYSASEPTVQRGGSDTITDSAGTDTDILFDAGSVEITLTSDGVSNWSL